jgi:hypothetical protein
VKIQVVDISRISRIIRVGEDCSEEVDSHCNPFDDNKKRVKKEQFIGFLTRFFTVVYSTLRPVVNVCNPVINGLVQWIMDFIH